MKTEFPEWLKSKGYLHITAQIDVQNRGNEILSKVQNRDYVAKYAFYPLIHAIIKERKYKRINDNRRAHSYAENGQYKRSTKHRPLHYATHLDAIIFGYYAELLQIEYEKKVKTNSQLDSAIIAYRKIPIENESTNKSTIHFAKEVFDEIKKRCHSDGDCCVLTFDIKSFFSSLNHLRLKKAWANLLDLDTLPNDHYNVFKAATKFSYILKDDLRLNTKRKEFDEKELARIRNEHGIQAFFDSPKSFREKINSGELKIHKYPFRNKDTGKPMGIPQGLPISAVLANLYLLEFDLKIIELITNKLNGYYRRYSDDIIVICKQSDAEYVENFVQNTIQEMDVEISGNKTEKFIFKLTDKKDISSIRLSKTGSRQGAPLTYLGFEYNGKHILIKSANLAKFYRRMISSVKRKANRAKKIAEKTPGLKPYVFKQQLYRLYNTKPLSKVKIFTRWKKLKKNNLGKFQLITGKKSRIQKSNYLSYTYRASIILNDPAIMNQIKKHKKIFHQALHRHLN